MKFITAIIRSINLEKVVKGLKETGVKGMTISEVKGIGEEIVLYKPYSVHNKIEIIVPEKEVDNVIETIVNMAQSREPGDGVVTVQKIEELIKIRSGEKVGPHDL